MPLNVSETAKKSEETAVDLRSERYVLREEKADA